MPVIKSLGWVEYIPTWRAMQDFTAQRTAKTVDELWVVEHPPVYTQGLAGKPEHLLYDNGIPVVATDRGGQITYHGPGQLVVYLLLDFKRLGMSVRALVRRIEQAIIDTLATWGVQAVGKVEAPGVYVAGAKIAALGLRIKNHAVYHGLSLNVNTNLTPFTAINPCGYANLPVTRLSDFGVDLTLEQVAESLLPHLIQQLNTAHQLSTRKAK